MCSSGSRWVSRWRGVWRDGLEALWRLESVSQILYMLSCFSHIWLFATPWTVAHQAPLSMGIYRQEYWSGLLCPPPGDILDPGIEPGWVSHVSCTCRRVLLYTHSLKGAKADMFYYLTFSFSKKKKSCIFKFLAAPCSMWDLSSPTRDQTHPPCIGRQSLNLWEVPDLLYSLSPALCTAPSYPGLESLRLEKLLQWDPPSAGLNHAVITATSTTWLPVT